MQENNCLELPQIDTNWHWCWKKEQHLNIDKNFDHQMSLSNSKYCVNVQAYLGAAKLEWCWKALYFSSLALNIED